MTIRQEIEKILEAIVPKGRGKFMVDQLLSLFHKSEQKAVLAERKRIEEMVLDMRNTSLEEGEENRDWYDKNYWTNKLLAQLKGTKK